MVHEPTLIQASDEFRQLDPRIIAVERITGWIVFAVILSAGLIALSVWAVASWPPGFSVGIGVVLFLLAMLMLAWSVHVLPRWSYETTFWRFDEKGLAIRRGIFWKRETTIPRVRVQHTDVYQGPLLRRFELAKLVVHTAGTHEASVEFNGLSHADAVALRDLLIADEGVDADVV